MSRSVALARVVDRGELLLGADVDRGGRQRQVEPVRVATTGVGVDEDERTELVTSGSFAMVRNPIFTAMLVTGAGIALVVPNGIALGGWVLLLLAIEFQVRVVEEPYLRRHHGEPYQRYLARVGRFLPGVGLTKPRTTPTPTST